MDQHVKLEAGIFDFHLDVCSLYMAETYSFFQISTGHHAFLFDMLKLGDTAFDEGLKHIFENENIQKVLYYIGRDILNPLHVHRIFLGDVVICWGN